MAEVVTTQIPVDAVEPIARIVAVAVERFGAQNVAGHVEEGHALGEANEAESHVLGADALGHRDGEGHFEDVLVKERLVVVFGDVGD